MDKLVKESISFERGKDPKKVLGIGIEAPRTFKTPDEFVDFLIEALPYIFNGKIPDDILSLSEIEGGILPWSYYNQIIKFLERTKKTYINKYGEIDDDWDGCNLKFITSWPAEVKTELLKLGYEG
jgi:hypothetical protein